MDGIQFCIPTEVESKPAGMEAMRNKPNHAPEPQKTWELVVQVP